jgi:hypothetical protein
MSRAEVNAKRSTVTLHVVSSLDRIIAKKDNSVSWLDSSGDVYEKGVLTPMRTALLPSTALCSVLEPTSMRSNRAGHMATPRPS